SRPRSSCQPVRSNAWWERRASESPSMATTTGAAAEDGAAEAGAACVRVLDTLATVLAAAPTATAHPHPLALVCAGRTVTTVSAEMPFEIVLVDDDRDAVLEDERRS